MSKLYSIVVLGMGASMASAQFLGPTPYLSTANIPWMGDGPFQYYHLENMESGAVSVPGVSHTAATIIGPGGLTDSVDADDGAVDGSGTTGRSLFAANGAPGIVWTFDGTALGGLPTHAGIVWTDGAGLVTFEAFDQNDVSLGKIDGSHADGSYGGTTGEDRFYGIKHSAGISKIQLSNSIGGIEMDHLQYGRAVPEPASVIALAIGAGACVLRRRRR